MSNLQRRKTLAFRAAQILLILLGGGLILLGVVFGFPPHANLIAAAVSTLAGALTLALGWSAIGNLGAKNRRIYDAHIRNVCDQVALLAGSTNTQQGIALGDWGNARWRDEGPNGERATYQRLPLLVPMGDFRWGVSNHSKINTGVPIDEIEGMENTLRHLTTAAPGQLDVEALVRDSRQCLANWRAFDSLFEERLLSLAYARLASPAPIFRVSWEDIPWSPPAAGRWTLGGLGLVFLSMNPPQTVDRPKFHPWNGADDRWFVKLGDSSTWLMTGSEPIPGPLIEDAFVSIIASLMPDSRLRTSYNTAVEYASSLRDRVNVVRRDLRDYSIDHADCDYCRAMWILGPGPG
jgi:hypothetical protein